MGSKHLGMSQPQLLGWYWQSEGKKKKNTQNNNNSRLGNWWKLAGLEMNGNEKKFQHHFCYKSNKVWNQEINTKMRKRPLRSQWLKIAPGSHAQSDYRKMLPPTMRMVCSGPHSTLHWMSMTLYLPGTRAVSYNLWSVCHILVGQGTRDRLWNFFRNLHFLPLWHLTPSKIHPHQMSSA